jgi:SpoVK/Ycf46/Vps4 family AAA+-type ATPase
VYVFEEGYWDKSEELYSAIQGATLEGLTLAPGLKEELLRDATTFFSSEASYAEYDIPWKRGLLLTGPPGNGKTHAIKGLINVLGKNCLYARSFSCENVSDQRNIRAVFQRARSTAPCVLILEDLDSLITDKNRSFFLNELDGFAENHGILVIATTNHPERLDAAIVERPSRFDRKYLFDLPALAERRTYLRRWHGGLRPELRVAEETLDRVAEQTGGFSFAYLKELVVSSTMRWVQDMKPGAMETILPATTELLRQQIHTVAGG